METGIKLSTKRELDAIRQEVRSLRSFVISVLGKDTEGEYRPQLVEELLRASMERPAYEYTGAGSLLKQLEEV